MKPALGVDAAKLLGIKLRNHELLAQALTHSSFGNLHKLPSNERLEFLGDAILSAVVAHRIYEEFPLASEGEMTRMRAQTVQSSSLAAAAQKLGLDRFVKHALKHPSAVALQHLYEQAFEALVAALFLQLGYDKTAACVKRWLPVAHTQEGDPNFNPKGQLQELLQPKITVEAIEYKLTKEAGPNHARVFTVELWIKGRKVTVGEASTKKKAEEQAAQEAIKILRRKH